MLRIRAVAVVGFVVEHEDVLLRAEVFTADAANNVGYGFGKEAGLRRIVAGKNCLCVFRDFDLFARKKRMIVRDHDPRLFELIALPCWNDVALGVVVRRVVGLENF